jgi:hypothetical protein
MGNISKGFTLIIAVIIAISSIIIISPANGQIGVTNPSIPAFDVTLQTYSSYIQPTYTVDPSTGKAVMIEEGHTEVAKWVGVQIGGQPFIRYNNSDGQLISLFYNVRWKGTHDTTWQSIPQDRYYRLYEDAGNLVDSQSTGVYISIGFKGIKGPNSHLQLLDPTATQIDFQVEALIGYYTADNVFVGQSSGWSNTQTLNVSDGSIATNSGTTSPSSPNATIVTQQTGNFDWEQIAIIGLVITVVLLVIALVFSRRDAQSK